MENPYTNISDSQGSGINAEFGEAETSDQQDAIVVSKIVVNPVINPVELILEAVNSGKKEVDSLLKIVENMQISEAKDNGPAIGKLLEMCLLHGLDNQETLQVVQSKFPESTATTASISGIRSKMRKSENPKKNCVPTIKQIRSRKVFTR